MRIVYFYNEEWEQKYVSKKIPYDTFNFIKESMRDHSEAVFAAGYGAGAEGREGNGEGYGEGQNSGHMMKRSQNQNESYGWWPDRQFWIK